MTQYGHLIISILGLGGWAALPAGAPVRTIEIEWSPLIPGDVIACYVAPGSSSPETTETDAPARAPYASLLDQAQALGLFGTVDACTRQWLDAIAMASHIFKYPHAVALFDISATPRYDGGHELSGLSGAVIVHTGDEVGALNRRVQHLLDTYTNATHSVLTTERLGQRTWITLRDRRLPDWCVIRWMVDGGRYVITVGDDALHRVLTTWDGASPSLSADDWFREASVALEARTSAFWLHARLTELRRRVDRDLGRKISDVLMHLRLGDVSRGLWTTRREGRALTMGAYLRRGSTDTHERIADRRFRRRLRDNVIPDAASRYAIVDCNPVRVSRGISGAYLAARSPGKSAQIRASWQHVQQTAGVDIERDIVKFLDHTVVIHNHPPHPLKLPGVRTILVKIDREPDALRRNLDQLLTYVRDVLIPPGLFQLRHTDDGIWHILYGLNGPGVTVLDDWVVIGFTPTAVREVRDALQTTPPPTTPAP